MGIKVRESLHPKRIHIQDRPYRFLHGHTGKWGEPFKIINSMECNGQFLVFNLTWPVIAFDIVEPCLCKLFSSLSFQYASFFWFSSYFADLFFSGSFPSSPTINFRALQGCPWTFRLFFFSSIPTPFVISSNLLALNTTYRLMTQHFHLQLDTFH